MRENLRPSNVTSSTHKEESSGQAGAGLTGNVAAIGLKAGWQVDQVSPRSGGLAMHKIEPNVGHQMRAQTSMDRYGKEPETLYIDQSGGGIMRRATLKVRERLERNIRKESFALRTWWGVSGKAQRGRDGESREGWI